MAGSGSINQPSTGVMQIQQNTDRMIADWNSFDIGSSESVTFLQPTANSIALNRVTGNNPSQIFGKLAANGNIFLINPNGILFGAGSQIDVNGLVATTSDIKNADFMAGRYNFANSHNSLNSVVNRGTITVKEAGIAAFVAPGVENSGIISANLGRVNLSSGSVFTLDFYGDKLITLGVDGKVLTQAVGPDGNPLPSFAQNSGKIIANGGQVVMQASAAKDIVDNVINMTGIVEAKTAQMVAGEIILDGGEEGIVNVSGTLDVTGSEPGQKGGTVQVLGEKVGLFNNALIDASGATGGGTILVGGDYRGQGDIQTSYRTFFGVDASVKADALETGDGGKVIVWSDDTTRFLGDISVQGGAVSGNGGFVETSGKEKLVFEGFVDLGAANGSAGTLLLDPDTINISTSSDSNTTGFTAGADNTEAFGDDAAATSTFDVTAGTGSFAGIADGATIILQATNDINVNNAFNLSSATGNNNVNLVLQAGDDIVISSSITADGTGTVHLEADSPHNGGADGSGDIDINSTITTGGGDVTLIGADFFISNTVNSGSGNIIVAQSQSSQAFILGIPGGAILTEGELDDLVTTGTLTLGQATTKGTDGAGTGAVTLTAGAITLDGLTQGAKNIALVSNSTINDDDDGGDTTIITTGTLTLTSDGQIGNLGGPLGLNTDVGTLVITSTGGNNVLIENSTTDLILGAINTGAGSFDVTTGGTITNNGALTIGGTASFTTDVANKSITLNNASNAISGTINVTNSGTADFTLNNGSTNATFGTVSVGRNLTAETTGDILFNNALSGLTNLTITQSNSTTFSNTVGASTVTLTDTTGAVTFNGALTATTLTTAAQGYSVVFNDGGTITNDATFSNTGGVTFGDNDGDSITFTGGLDTTAGTTTARGTVLTTNTQMDIGAVTLAGTTVFDTGTGASSILNIGAVTGAANDLTLDSGANAAADITVASVSGVGTLTVRDSGGTTISGTTGATTVTLTDTTGAVTFGGAITATTLNTTAQAYSVGFKRRRHHYQRHNVPEHRGNHFR